jgi:uncharacterized protein
METGVKRGLVRLALWLWLALWSAVVLGDVPVPALNARVTDLTGTLNASQQATLEQSLAAFEAKKGSQIAILLVPSTQPETIEQFSMRVAEAWKLGRKGVDDGVLVLVAKNDRKLRIEVGYGLEGAIPDVVAKRIVSDIISPQFKQGKFYEGLQAGIERIAGVIEGEPLPLPKAAPTSKGKAGDGGDWWGMAFVVALIAGGILRVLLGALLGGLVAGGVAGGVVWLVTGSFLFMGFAALIAFAVTLFGGSLGALSGGGWSSGSSGSGGFSGGGGGFGGGGASGGVVAWISSA